MALQGRAKMTINQPAYLVGDVAFWNLPYAREFLELDPGVRVVALKRNRADNIKGFVRAFESIRHFPWASDAQRAEMRRARFEPNPYDRCYPTFEWPAEELTLMTVEQGTARYYDAYYALVDELRQAFPERVRLFDTYEALNNSTVQGQIFDFLQVPLASRHYEVVRTKTSKEQAERDAKADARRAQQAKQAKQHRAKAEGRTIRPKHADENAPRLRTRTGRMMP